MTLHDVSRLGMTLYPVPQLNQAQSEIPRLVSQRGPHMKEQRVL